MHSVTVAQRIVEMLERAGVRRIFGLPGTQVAAIYDALRSSSITHVLVRHEQAAAFMADAHARVTGSPGVCLATVGPGAMNLVTGLMTSFIDSIPVVALTGQQPARTFGRGAQTEVDHRPTFASLTKWQTMLLVPDRVTDTVARALRTATSGRPGPVHLDLPADVLQASVEVGDVDLARWRPQGAACGDPSAIERAADLLVRAERPLMMAGGGCHYTADPPTHTLVALAEALAMPVATSLNGLGSFPMTHPLSAGRAGVYTTPYTNDLVAAADVLLVVGCRLSGLVTRNWTLLSPHTRIVQVDIDPCEIARNYPVEVGIAGDAGAVLEALLGLVAEHAHSRPPDGWGDLARRRTQWAQSWDQAATSGGAPVKPQRICRSLRRLFGPEAIFTAESGDCHFWPMFEDYTLPRTWIHSGSGSSMGYALPAAIACKLAHPERDVVAICGDGGFNMHGLELTTAVQAGAPVVAVILNNASLATIRHVQQARFGGRIFAVDLINPDFAAMARACGCHGERVETAETLEPAIERARRAAWEGRPALIDVFTDPHEQLPGWA